MHRLGLHRVDGSGKGEEFILMYVRAIRLTGKCFVYRVDA